MATLDAPKLLVLTNQTKLTLTVTLTLTDTVMQKSKKYCIGNTVKPLIFVCPLFCKFHELKLKLKGAYMCLMFTGDLKLLMLELCGLNWPK